MGRDYDDPYERHYENLRDEDYWRHRLDEIKDVYTPKPQLDIPSAPPESSPEKTEASGELLQERSNCARLLRRFGWIPQQGREWSERLNAIDLVSRPRSDALAALQSLQAQIREHERFLWDYGKPYELAAIRGALSSLDRVIELLLK